MESASASNTVFSGSEKSGIDQGSRNKIADLSTSNSEVLELMQKKFGRDDLSPLQQQELQFLFSQRQEKVSLLSNLIRAFFDTMSNVVRNIRA